MTTWYKFMFPIGGNLLELVDFETWRELQCNILMQRNATLQFGKIGVIDREGLLNVGDWVGQDHLENSKDHSLFLCLINLSISTGSASCASKENWGKATSVVVEVFDQKELLVQLKHGARNFAEECREASKLFSANNLLNIWGRMACKGRYIESPDGSVSA